MTPAQKNAFITRTRQHVAELAKVINEIKFDDTRYVGTDMGTQLVEADFAGEHSGISKAEFIDGVSAFRAVVQAWETNKTNLLKIGD